MLLVFDLNCFIHKIYLYFKFYFIFKMVSKEKLEEYRETVQKIIDKYLPEEKRFSVKNFSEEWLFYVAGYFTEKDEGKRKALWNEMTKKRVESEERLKKAEYEFQTEDIDIKKEKEKYDNIFNTLEGLWDLTRDISLDSQLNNKINNK